MRELDLVLFDLDGTLFDHEGAARAAAAPWLRSLGIAPTEALMKAWFDAESRGIAAWHRGEMDWDQQRRARVREILSHVGSPIGNGESLDRAFADYLSRYRKAWRTYSDVEPALRALEQDGLEIAVLTNGSDDQQRAKIAAVGLDALVGSVFSSDAIGFAKPDRRAYLHVCSELMRLPATVLHVGDRHDIDVVAARAAGLRAVHLDRACEGPRDEPDRIASLTDLRKFIRRAAAEVERPDHARVR